MEGRGRRGEWAWDREKETEKRRGGVSFQSDACQALTKVLVFWGGCDMDWGMDKARGGWVVGGNTQLSSRDF